MPQAQGQVTFIGGERKDTQTGKERYVVQSGDGREFSVWDAGVFQAIMSHLHEDLKTDIFSKAKDGGGFWFTITGLPDLGVQAPRANTSSGSTPAPAPGAGPDMSALLPVLERIALALENMLQFTAERYMDVASADIDDDEPEPPDA